MTAHPPRPGDSVIDLGCGFGDTTQRLAGLVGPDGSALGVDVSEPFIEPARKEAEEAGVENVRFEAADVQVADFEETFDYAFSRMGIMFFANPVQALRNVRASLAPGGRLCAVVWRRKLDNELGSPGRASSRSTSITRRRPMSRPAGPARSRWPDADTVSDQLKIAGFEEITLRRCDLPLKIGNDLDHAVEFNMALGPAGEVLRLWEDRIDEIRPKIAADLREALAEFEGPDGVFAPASTWIIGAQGPARRSRRRS